MDIGENMGEKRLELNYGRGRICCVGLGVGNEFSHGQEWSGRRLKVQFSRRYEWNLFWTEFYRPWCLVIGS